MLAKKYVISLQVEGLLAGLSEVVGPRAGPSADIL
jgi:hypothetical protein